VFVPLRVRVPAPCLVKLPAVPEPLKFEITPETVASVVVFRVSVRPVPEASERNIVPERMVEPVLLMMRVRLAPSLVMFPESVRLFAPPSVESIAVAVVSVMLFETVRSVEAVRVAAPKVNAPVPKAFWWPNVSVPALSVVPARKFAPAEPEITSVPLPFFVSALLVASALIEPTVKVPPFVVIVRMGAPLRVTTPVPKLRLLEPVKVSEPPEMAILLLFVSVIAPPLVLSMTVLPTLIVNAPDPMAEALFMFKAALAV